MQQRSARAVLLSIASFAPLPPSGPVLQHPPPVPATPTHPTLPHPTASRRGAHSQWPALAERWDR